MKFTPSDIVLAGHPFVPIGMGEHVRSSFRAFRAASLPASIFDIYGFSERDPAISAELESHLTDRLSPRLNVFHINGNEVEQALAHRADAATPGSYNIIYPLWELERYPAEWARQLERFDEVWAPSQFIRNSITKAVSIPVHHMPLACEVHFSSFLGRRYFGIPEDRYVFFFFFDFTSYLERKNPLAVVEAFDRLMRDRPHAEVALVIKLNSSQHRPQDFAEFKRRISPYADCVHIIDKVLSNNEMKNLIRCCDCFVSLHRSEGFGLGLSEAMYLGKPVIATGYSGNMDFTNQDNALLVDFSLIPVALGSYPHGEGQVWADPDVDQAARHMVRLVDDADFGRALGKRASRHIRQHFSYCAAGRNYRTRVEQILLPAPSTDQRCVLVS